MRMGAVKVMARAIEEKDLLVLKQLIEQVFGIVWFDGIYNDKEGGFKAYLTFEVKTKDE